jgi:GNAT superfamily N-acetyltransferase
MLTIRPVNGKPDWTAFNEVPPVVYRNDPHWTPDDTLDLDMLADDVRPDGRRRADMQAFVAHHGTVPVGRVVAIADHRYNEYRDDRAAFFGFYETIDRDDVAFGLLDAVADWARERRLTHLYGPVNLSMAHSAGMLITGCERPGLVGMPYNPVYYPEHVARWGMRKVKDLHSYQLPAPRPRAPGERRAPQGWRPMSGMTFRTLDPERFDDEVETIRRIYNAAFVDFWGFAPVESDEFRELAEGFRPVLDPELVVFAAVDGEDVGYLMAIPDVNQAHHARVDMLAVRPAHQHTWIGGMLIFELLRRVYRRGYASAEAAPILEDATWPHSLRGSLTLSRVYRIYGRELTAT